jgi:competence protein ComEC
MINFKAIPFLKIIVPYIIGIIFFLKFGLLTHLHLAFFVTIILWIISFMIQYFVKQKRELNKITYIVITNAILFFLAHEACFLYNAKNNSNHYTHYVSSQPQSFIATITDIPVKSEKFIKIPVQINCIEENKQWHYAEGNSIVNLRNDSSVKFNLGNTLLLNTTFSHVNEPKNPNEFDYKAFLENRNTFHVVYATTNNAHIFSKLNNKYSITNIGVQIKSHLISVLRNSNLSQSAFSICSALLVGYDDEIDSEVMQSFSHSGTLHILSVSGMHTGVLYAILIYIFSLFDKYDRYKKTKFVFVLSVLCLFVVVTGLSPSVLRAALMLGLILFGKTFYKQGNAYNTLLFSAFLLLLINPYLVKDVGFLLSYCAVGGIMYLYPILAKLYVFQNKIIQWLWTSVLISVAATIFTLPVSLYFFHQFPIWFVLSNLLIIPISMLLMLGAALFLILYKIAFLNQLLVYLINGTTSLMLWLAQLTDNPQYGFVDFIPFTKTDILFLSLVIALSLLIIASKQHKHVLILCSIIITWLLVSIFDTFQQKQEKEFVVFHVKQKTVFALRLGQTIYAHFDDICSKEFQRYVKPYLLTISNLKVVDTKSNVLQVDSTYIVNNHQNVSLSKTLTAKYILISKDMPLELTTNYKSKPMVIADCSNSYKFVKQLKKQCALLEIPFYWVKENGAIQITL